MFCPNCGKEIRPGGKFCTSCGWKLPESGRAPEMPPNRPAQGTGRVPQKTPGNGRPPKKGGAGKWLAIFLAVALGGGALLTGGIMALTARQDTKAEEQEDSAQKEASAGKEKKDEEFDWYVYIRDELLPLYGYADMNDMSRDVSSGNSMDSYGWNQRTGILGADVADITGDDNEDMILYRLAPQAGNNPDYVRREVLATLYTETDGKVTEHETLSVGSADGISFDLDELGLMEVQGQTCLWHNTVGSAYFADGAGQDTEFIGWDGSTFRRLWWVGKSDGGSSEIAYSFRTYSDAENYTQEVLFGDEGYMYTHPGAVTAGAKNYAEAIIMGYQRLGLPDPGVATDPNAHFSAYPGRWEDGAFPSCWDSEVLAESVLVKTSGGGSYRLRSIVDHVEDRTGLREKIEALN